MYCKGRLRREKIVTEYKLTPVLCVKLLGEVKRSCAGPELSDLCYYFHYESKGKSGKDEGDLICGKTAADHFFYLLNVEPLTPFNPFEDDESENHNLSNNVGNNYGKNGQTKWDPLAKELYNAIHLLVMGWNLNRVDGALFNIITELNKNPTSQPSIGKVKAVNKIISKDSKNRKLTDMVADMKSNEQNLKAFPFPLINEKLKEKGITHSCIK